MTSAPIPPQAAIRYVGFWKRVVASVVDSILMAVLLAPFSLIVFGSFDVDDVGGESEPAHLVLKLLIPAMVVLVFWIRLQATPGKMMFHARIVDADTGADAKPWQLVLRYLGYFVSIITLGIGFLWVAIDDRKQGFHDKIASTVVVRSADPPADTPGIVR
jgi:uncharacterized RDD family membrane protein YckC